MNTRTGKLPYTNQFIIDPILVFTVIALLALGIVMVTSSSIVIAQRNFQEPFYYSFHQVFCILLGLMSALIILAVPTRFWYRCSAFVMFTAFIFLILVLIPGIGRVVNGSARWLNLGFTTIQVSEFCKLSVVLYLSSYIVRHQADLKKELNAFIRPMFLLSFIGGLLIFEPDFGAVVVILATALGMLFIAGVPLRQFVVLLLAVGLILAIIAISAPYRLARLTSFLDPWAVAFDSGYQLTQALIAFGRGEWLGVGLGSSVQKLFYLPEAHTDFIFAVLAEELGLIGALFTLALYLVFIWRGIMVGLRANQRREIFSGFVAYGITIWVGLQTFINVGVNTGLLPTKGLTLPFLSYGGSSITILCMAVGFLLRVDYENRRNFQSAI